MIETEFVPVCIYNNVEGGHDEQVLKAYGEPPWNFQVFRLLDAEGTDILPRVDLLRTTNMLCEWLLHTYDARELEAPRTLEMIRDETYLADHPQRISLATFSMHCYWVGEQKLGGLDGVLRTRAGWIGEREVVEVEFDHEVVPYADLVAKAAELECLDRIFTHDREQAKVARRAGHGELVEDLTRAARSVEPTEQWYHLRRSPLGHLPLTSVQCTKLNAAATYAGESTNPVFGAAVETLLTVRQRANLARLEAVLAEHPNAFDGWFAPGRTDGLAEYRARFEARLAELEVPETGAQK